MHNNYSNYRNWKKPIAHKGHDPTLLDFTVSAKKPHACHPVMQAGATELPLKVHIVREFARESGCILPVPSHQQSTLRPFWIV